MKLQQGSNDPAVLLLRARLQASGDLQEQGLSQSFDYYVDKAVKRYQASNGLAPTGVVDKSTIAALNVPAASRLKQLQLNLDAPRASTPRPPAANTWWSTSRRRRSRPSTTTRWCRGTPAWSARSTGRRRC